MLLLTQVNILKEIYGETALKHAIFICPNLLMYRWIKFDSGILYQLQVEKQFFFLNVEVKGSTGKLVLFSNI